MSRARYHLKRYFVPHEGNGYKPHILHSKRALFYSLVFLLMKAVLIVFAVLVPAQAFLLPDVLAEQTTKIVALTNRLRVDKGLPVLSNVAPLTVSAQARADDMATEHYFSHYGPHKHTLSYFLTNAKYPYRVAGENLAVGFSDAEAVVGAWIKSPKHYANLVDGDFRELGLGLESGIYQGEATVFVAQHFGSPLPGTASDVAAPAMLPVKTISGISSNEITFSAVASSTSTIASTGIRGEKVIAPIVSSSSSQISFDQANSHVYWLEESGSTVLRVRATLAGAVKKAVVTVGSYPIELAPGKNANQFVGQLTVSDGAETFFRPAVMPTITITSNDGAVFKDSIEWYNIKVSPDTTVERYLRAKRMLSPLTNIFSVSKNIYFGFIVFFSLALLTNIVVEIRKQHFYVIAQTLLMLGLLVILWRV